MIMDLATQFEEPKILFKWVIFIIAVFVTAICSLFLKISPFLLAAFISVIIYTVAILYRPSLGAYAYVFTLGFSALLNLPITNDGLKLPTVLALIAFLVWIARALLTADRDLITKPFSQAVHLFMGLILFTMIISLMNSRKIGASIGEIKQFIYCLTGHLLILFTIKNINQFRKLIIFKICAGFIVSILGIMEGTIGSIYTFLHNKSLFKAPLARSILWTSADRINGLVGDGDNHGIYMGMIFMFSLYLFFTVKSKILKILLVPVMFASLFNVIGAASRGAVLGFSISFFIFWICINLPKKWLILTSALALILIIGSLMIVIIPDLNIERLFDPGAEAMKTVDLRKNNLIIGLAMTKDHPIIGSGPDGFILNYLRYGPRITPTSRRIPTKPLNAYLQALVEYGIIGFILFLSVTIFILKSLIMLLINATGEDRYLVAVILAVFCGYTSFMNTTGFFVDQPYWLVVTLAAVFITIYDYQTEDRKGMKSKKGDL